MMSYCHDLCEQRDASIEQMSRMDSVGSFGGNGGSSALGQFLNQFKMDYAEP